MRMTIQRQNDQFPNRERSRPSPLSHHRPPFLGVNSEPETSDLWFRHEVVRPTESKSGPAGGSSGRRAFTRRLIAR
jgi:hypothetical protein